MVSNWPSDKGGGSTAATYSDTSDRYGYQYQVNGYVWEEGLSDYSKSSTGTYPVIGSNGRIPSGYDIHCVKLADANDLFGVYQNDVPFFLQTVKACFVVDESWIKKSDEYKWEISGYEVNICECVEQSLLKTITLTKDMFGYDSKYADITKLYTAPYSYLEVTDNNGETKRVNIENTGSIELRLNTSIAYPFIRIEPFITGIGGSGTIDYKWYDLTGEHSERIFKDDFGEYTWDWDIPTYALYVQGSQAYSYTRYNDAEYDRTKAITNYHKTLRLANTDYENTVDSADNTVTMVGNSASTEYTNAVAENDTQRTNTYNSASTAYTNAVNTAATEQANANRSAATNQTNRYNEGDLLTTNQQVANAAATAIATTHTTNNTNATNANNGLNQALQAWDAGYSRAMTDEENSAIMASAAANAVGGIAASIGNGIASGNPLGMIGSVVSGAANAAASGVTTMITAAKNSTQCESGISNSQSKVDETNSNNSNLNSYANNTTINDNTNSVNSAYTQADNQKNTIKTNADNTKSTENTNAGATYSTSVTNAGNTQSTDKTNADNTQSTGNANAARTQSTTNTNATLERDVTVANSDYTRKAHVLNAQDDMELARLDNSRAYSSHSFDAPVKYAGESGDMTLDVFRRRGLQFKVKTQRDGDIAQAGDLMLRFGYALNQVWNIGESGFNLMRHFTFWKASDVWVSDDDLSTGRVQVTIKDILTRGVTVWSNPDEIGRVSIYDN